MGSKEGDIEIVKAIATLAHNLKMEVVAEGVESERQLEQLRMLRCEYVQGYLFSRPLDNKEMRNVLRHSRDDLISYSPINTSADDI
jgi:EAL domain-containing protein (putative c-di-GMP-specific phosphodiesterase class I)